MNSFLKWAPRILNILFILFLLMFSFDVFIEEYTVGEMIVGFLMHNIPTGVIALVLILSWKRPQIGGVVFIIVGLLYMFLMRNSEDVWYEAMGFSMILAGPAILTGILYLLDWRVKERG